MTAKKYKFNYNDLNITIENNIINENWDFLDKSYKYVIITDTNVASAYKKILNEVPNGIAILSLKPGVNIKTLNSYEKVIKNFITLGVTKNDILIAFGGNYVQNLSCFIASTYLNGIKLIQIPTTIYSQINSGIIGNNTLYVNNSPIIGTNYLADNIIIDPSFIKSLSDTELQKGIIEIIKLGIIKDNEILSNITDNKIDNNDSHYIHHIEKCLDINYNLSSKKEYIKKEPSILNFGELYYDLISNLSKGKLSSAEIKAISMYFEIKQNLREKLLKIYEVYFDINKLQNYINLFTKNIEKNTLESNIEIIKLGHARIIKNKVE